MTLIDTALVDDLADQCEAIVNDAAEVHKIEEADLHDAVLNELTARQELR